MDRLAPNCRSVFRPRGDMTRVAIAQSIRLQNRELLGSAEPKTTCAQTAIVLIMFACAVVSVAVPGYGLLPLFFGITHDTVFLTMDLTDKVSAVALADTCCECAISPTHTALIRQSAPCRRRALWDADKNVVPRGAVGSSKRSPRVFQGSGLQSVSTLCAEMQRVRTCSKRIYLSWLRLPRSSSFAALGACVPD